MTLIPESEDALRKRVAEAHPKYTRRVSSIKGNRFYREGGK